MKSKPPKHYRRVKNAHPDFIPSWEAIMLTAATIGFPAVMAALC